MRRYFRTLVLCKTPLEVVFRYKDLFQIYPIENDALINNSAKHHPLYLEYCVNVPFDISKVDLAVESLNQEKEIVRLLSLFSTFRFFFYTGDSDRWGIMTPPLPFCDLTKEQQERFVNQISSWTISVIQTKYHKYEVEIPCLTDVPFKEMVFAPDIEKYFKYCVEDDITKQIAASNGYQMKILFPTSLNECLDVYYALPLAYKKIFRSAIYLANDGMDIRTSHKALGFFAIAAALEGLTKLFEEAYPITEKSGHIKYPKKKQCFINLLTNYYSAHEYDVFQYEKLYETRCDVAHENKLFTLDYGLTLDEDNFNPSEEWFKTNNLLICFRTVLTNLLLNTERKGWIKAE